MAMNPTTFPQLCPLRLKFVVLLGKVHVCRLAWQATYHQVSDLEVLNQILGSVMAN